MAMTMRMTMERLPATVILPIVILIVIIILIEIYQRSRTK
jgi:hypothetical protein